MPRRTHSEKTRPARYPPLDGTKLMAKIRRRSTSDKRPKTGRASAAGKTAD